MGPPRHLDPWARRALCRRPFRARPGERSRGPHLQAIGAGGCLLSLRFSKDTAPVGEDMDFGPEQPVTFSLFAGPDPLTLLSDPVRVGGLAGVLRQDLDIFSKDVACRHADGKTFAFDAVKTDLMRVQISWAAEPEEPSRS